MEHNDCSFVKDNNWFRYRAGAIIIENDCVLLVTNEACDYYYSVGGGVHLGETAETAVLREVYEETGVNYEIDRLAFVHENLFIGEGNPFDKMQCHEIALFFLMKSRGTQQINSNSYCCNGKETLIWMPISDLHTIKLYPEIFSINKLKNISINVEHIITKEY